MRIMANRSHRRQIPPTIGSQSSGECWGYKELWIAGTGSMGTTMAWSSFVNFYPTLMLDVYDVSLNWTGLLLAIGIAVGGPSGIALSRIVPRVSGNRRRNILQAIGVTMVVTYLGMTLTDSIPSAHRNNARQRCGAGILANPQLDTILPARHKAAGVHRCAILHDDAGHLRGCHRPGARRRAPRQARRPETRYDHHQLRAAPARHMLVYDPYTHRPKRRVTRSRKRRASPECVPAISTTGSRSIWVMWTGSGNRQILL